MSHDLLVFKFSFFNYCFSFFQCFHQASEFVSLPLNRPDNTFLAGDCNKEIISPMSSFFDFISLSEFKCSAPINMEASMEAAFNTGLPASFSWYSLMAFAGGSPSLFREDNA